MKIVLSILCLFIITCATNAQHYAVYNDYLDKVQLFDNGKFKEIEHLPLHSFQLGNNAVAYEDNSRGLKVYHNGYTYKVADIVDKYTNTDGYVSFILKGQLRVFDNGETKTLSLNCKDYATGDEVVAYYDDTKSLFKVYENGQDIELDDVLTTNIERDFKVGENLVVYKDAQGYFHIYYDQENFEMLYFENIKSYKAGRDIVAFVESPADNFQVFINGEFDDIDDFEPKSYKMGDGFVAYIDSNDYLKVYDSNGENTISFDAPRMYEVEDEMLLFTVQNYFKLYWNGKVYTLESTIPEDFKVDGYIVSYIDEHGYLKVFDRGLQKTLTYENVESFDCHGGTVVYQYGINSVGIYSNGQIYSGE